MKTDYSTTETSKLRIAILLSTYNGERYLPALLDSVLGQSWPYWDLLVRDDGSTDGTAGILKTYRDRLEETQSGNRMYVTEGKNIGVVHSFIRLLDNAPDGYTGFAFCDQDDIWQPEKMEKAVNALKDFLRSAEAPQKPFAYHSRQLLMEGDKKTKASKLPKHIGFSNALIENQMVGCTMLINNALKKGIRQLTVQQGEDNHQQWQDGSYPAKGIIMHDWWCYLLVSAFGEIMYDPTPLITFRRHDKSTTPVATNRYRAFLKRISALRLRAWTVTHILEQAALFKKVYVEATDAPRFEILSRDKRDSLEELLSLRGATFSERLRYTITSTHFRSGVMDTLVFRLMVLFNRY